MKQLRNRLCAYFLRLGIFSFFNMRYYSGSSKVRDTIKYSFTQTKTFSTYTHLLIRNTLEQRRICKRHFRHIVRHHTGRSRVLTGGRVKRGTLNNAINVNEELTFLQLRKFILFKKRISLPMGTLAMAWQTYPKGLGGHAACLGSISSSRSANCPLSVVAPTSSIYEVNGSTLYL